jgi:hypothetical protein
MVETTDPHLVLLELVAAEDDQALRLVLIEQDFGAFLAKRTGSPGDQNILAVKIEHRISLMECRRRVAPSV